MGLNTFDPVIDFGTDVRLTLSAAGQLACPAQALWILGSILERIDSLRNMPTFGPEAQVQAYRSWLLMRCRQVWPADSEVIKDQKLVEMMSFWVISNTCHWLNSFSNEMGRTNRGLNKYCCCFGLFDSFKGNPVSATPASVDPVDEDETPIFDSPIIVDDDTTVGCLCADSCTVVFKGLSEPPLCFQPRCGATIKEFSKAHSKLVGPFDIVSITMNGRALDHGACHGSWTIDFPGGCFRINTPQNQRSGCDCLTHCCLDSTSH